MDTVTALRGVAFASRGPADRRALCIGRARRIHAAADLRRIADAGRRAAHRSRGPKCVGRTVTHRAVARLVHVARSGGFSAHGPGRFRDTTALVVAVAGETWRFADDRSAGNADVAVAAAVVAARARVAIVATGTRGPRDAADRRITPEARLRAHHRAARHALPLPVADVVGGARVAVGRLRIAERV